LVRAVFEENNGVSRNLPLYRRGKTTLTILSNAVLFAMGKNWKLMDRRALAAWERVVADVVAEIDEGIA
jgi:hypothetical protein